MIQEKQPSEHQMPTATGTVVFAEYPEYVYLLLDHWPFCRVRLDLFRKLRNGE